MWPLNLLYLLTINFVYRLPTAHAKMVGPAKPEGSLAVR